MHVHILGICGSFMGGIAALAKSLGHTVTGSDRNVYPPMSTQLEQLGITLTEGYDVSQFEPEPDMVIIGNAMSRGNPAVEYVLNRGLPYTSGPQWLLDNLLKDRWVLGVAGTHGKTSTSSMLAWILEDAGYTPGFLIGGVPENFGVSARVGEGNFFVIEADEYDSAFFDKRSKFVHYRPRTLVLNNLEFDHADIFDDLNAIKKQFHHLVRSVPQNGLILSEKHDHNMQDVLEMGCWSEQEFLSRDWAADKLSEDGSRFAVYYHGELQGNVEWSLIGDHNVHNGLMAIAAAHHVGVTCDVAIKALTSFVNVKRRMEIKGKVNNVTVYDDFAHHPTAITTTVKGLKAKVGVQRVLAVLEPRSNTMKQGVHKDALASCWSDADEVYLFEPANLGWSMHEVANASTVPVHSYQDVDKLVAAIVAEAQPSDHILVMSNGGFAGIHGKLIDALSEKFGE
ncbi:UDP-N-acetylmuramate:L-alanyl-gamma-D-glutamyl-meso-diaminopimelate ligase [Alteromonas sp. LMIT006]|jgi:UDP-N-acetylmuramate: L-alanyl-gamma-D-glutamyl-meso-diaminopimelate ligase|uniref:UDP-N-acetylmuramate:L-alanyl-gamma-D-glutamyl- meso-diaminopimelate ligase n=1 Tax=Alteromonadaceae TaxID=72275 RepID=UPI0020CA7A90|nr:UDP-N-acetylmuramate:L-alanyl-gamma-D-glutamyl-meso-diaminopimelate ligase [Alteromonas sp. LMIT006]UTP73367.1 UDP-N-acetylmuramate:L-alanyl-gamma-D-glutamyl-meso-diaminopimelate ligase [Alteromonas sp. LMIT006]